MLYKGFFWGLPGRVKLKSKRKKKEKCALLKCEGRYLDSEKILKFRPTSQMRLSQAVVVFQDSLLKRMTGEVLSTGEG